MAVKFDNSVMATLFPAICEKTVKKSTAEIPQCSRQTLEANSSQNKPVPPVPAKEKEHETFSLQERETLYQSPHTVKLSANHARIEIIEGGEPLVEGEYPCDFDELIIFMDKHGITAKETTDGLLITGGTGEQRQRVITCLNSSIWIYGNLRHYLDGTLRDIDGRKYRLPIIQLNERQDKLTLQR